MTAAAAPVRPAGLMPEEVRMVIAAFRWRRDNTRAAELRDALDTLDEVYSAQLGIPPAPTVGLKGGWYGPVDSGV